ncbi:MAG: hypothetical protein GY898_30455 [Proteobacteria bacterium]|nr:hypothetical protein [Pseudomonadota bacterium]
MRTRFGLLLTALLLVPTAASAQDAPVDAKTVLGTEATALHGVAFRPGLNVVYGADAAAGTVYRWDALLDAADLSSTASSFSFGASGDVQGLAWDSVRHQLYVLQGADLVVYDASGVVMEQFQPFDGDALSDVTVDANGSVYVADTTGAVRVFDRTDAASAGLERFKVLTAGSMLHFHGLDLDPLLDRLWGTESEGTLLRRYDGAMQALDGATLSPAVNIAPANGRTDLQGLAFDEVSRLMYIATHGQYIQVYDAEGVFIEEFSVPLYTRGVAAHDNLIWTMQDDRIVTRWERTGLGSYNNLGTFTVTNPTSGSAPTIDYDPHRDLLWANYWAGEGWAVYDATSGTLLDSYSAIATGEGVGHSAGFGAGLVLEGTETMPTDRMKFFKPTSGSTWTETAEWDLPGAWAAPSIAYDADRDYVWATHFNGGSPDDLYGLDPSSGAVIQQSPVDAGAWGHGLDYADGQLILATETLAVDGARIFDFETDSDGDGWADSADNCPNDANFDQANFDGDSEGDVCDADDDNDLDPDVTDCADFDDTIFTGATELCDTIDSDCDGSLVDEFDDFDGDLDPDCTDPDDDNDLDLDDDDCDDFDASIYTDAPELCDAIDSDCDGSLVDEFANFDGDDEPDCIDDDDDNDGFDSSLDCNDFDAAIYPTAPELCDGIDSDCDGSLVDEFDDFDGDDEPDCTDTDDDNDGLSDDDEATAGSDPLNPDSDGDGIGDAIEVGDPTDPTDTDDDGLADFEDDDDDGDGILTSDEGVFDPDGDTIPNYLDEDSDGDGFEDGYEGDGDADSDGTPNYLDTDADGENDSDDIDGDGDADLDGIPDFLDIDDTDGPDADPDGDGLSNAEEAVLGTDPQDADSDGDGLDDGAEVGADLANPVDSDGDTTIDALDPDDDGDGIGTLDENTVDADLDGEPDADADEDGTDNYLDDDSDDDGLTDLDEGDGDFDEDGIPNYVDTDADGDGIDDIDEGDVDTDGDGAIDAYDLDSDGDGFTDEEEGGGDLDGDGIPNFQDLDVDGDGIDDAIEGDGDLDSDGIPNWLDPDDADGPDADPDGDGLSNIEESDYGTDAYDADSDDDGLEDGEEVFETETDPTDPDSDGDGLDDGTEVLDEGTDPNNPDTDGDGLTDGDEVDVHETNPLSPDTDEDGMDDGTEVEVGADPHDQDTDGDGILDGPDGLGDDDEDGIINVLDPTDDSGTTNDDDDDIVLDDDDIVTGGAGPDCGCAGSSIAAEAPASAGWLGLTLLAGLLVRRRRD